MATRDGSRVEASEAEVNPEAAAAQAVESAVAEREGKASSDSWLWEKTKKLGNSFLDSTNPIRIVPLTLFRVVRGIFDFAVKAIEKKGKMSFKEGYGIGQDIFSTEFKKNDKK